MEGKKFHIENKTKVIKTWGVEKQRLFIRTANSVGVRWWEERLTTWITWGWQRRGQSDGHHWGYVELKYTQKLNDVWGWVGSSSRQGRVCWQYGVGGRHGVSKVKECASDEKISTKTRKFVDYQIFHIQNFHPPSTNLRNLHSAISVPTSAVRLF